MTDDQRMAEILKAFSPLATLKFERTDDGYEKCWECRAMEDDCTTYLNGRYCSGCRKALEDFHNGSDSDGD